MLDAANKHAWLMAALRVAMPPTYPLSCGEALVSLQELFMVESGTGLQRDEPDLHFCGFHHLMPHRVENLLLVSSLYESFILEEEGLLSELITSEYIDLSLSHAPRVSRVSTTTEAIGFIQSQPVDLVITMATLVQRSLRDFAKAVKRRRRN
ncbi:MAG: hypothetical protein WBE26_03100 [Phycisphaerae bacterium]